MLDYRIEGLSGYRIEDTLYPVNKVTSNGTDKCCENQHTPVYYRAPHEKGS